jgi:hypothetical protein
MKKLLLPWQSADALLYAYRTSFKSTHHSMSAQQNIPAGCFFMLFAPVAHDAGEIGLLWICIKLCSSRMRTNDFVLYMVVPAALWKIAFSPNPDLFARPSECDSIC